MDSLRRDKGLYWDRAWKLVEGCSKASAGCDHCWSEAETFMRANHPNEKIADRAQAVTLPDGGFCGNIVCRKDNLDLPLKTKKPTVWAVWNDLFHEDVQVEFIVDAFQTMERARKLGHVFIVLTKRADVMGNFLEGVGIETPDHIWWGVTAENQEQADLRIPHLLRVPGKRFVSIEPILGTIDLTTIAAARVAGGRFGINSLDQNYACIHAVLLGGESGINARPMNPKWARDVRDQCDLAGVPFFFKQNGEWASVSEVEGPGQHHYFPDGRTVRRVGKKRAGRLLDGRTHDDLPWG